VYEEVRQVRLTASRVHFVHRDGAASVKIAELTAELRAKLGYDPAAAAAHEAQGEAKQAAYEQQVDRSLNVQAQQAAAKAAAVDAAKRQIVRHYYSDRYRSTRVATAKRYLTQAGIPAARQDEMIQSWLPEAAAYEKARRERWSKATGGHSGQLRNVPELPPGVKRN
jgi:hypothetical protein